VRRARAAALALASLPGTALPAAVPDGLAATPRCEYELVRELPHRREAFTQGLAFDGERLLEGTGLYGRSGLARLDLEGGEVLRETRLPGRYFGEGITVLGERVYQLTWRNRKAFAYDRESLEPLAAFALDGEGWGLTHDGARLVLSDGTPVLRFLDPRTFSETGRVTVRADGQPVRGLNELEWVGGEVLANLWPTDALVRIDPGDGRVLGWLDLADLRRRQGPLAPEAVANGIAYEPRARVLLVTGKLWSRIYSIRPAGQGCGALADRVGP
jgi:glutamine cyclotransferase